MERAAQEKILSRFGAIELLGVPMGKFVDKTQLNVNHTTNATGLLSVFGVLGTIVYGVANHKAVGDWLPTVFIGAAGAIAQWLQGIPTPTTKLIASVLHLDESRTNAEMLWEVFRRIISTGIVPGLEQSSSVLNADTAKEMQVDMVDSPRPASRLSVSNPEVISEAWRQADIARGRKPIEGTDMYPSEYVRGVMAGNFDNVTQG
jgi:hypothetical protein